MLQQTIKPSYEVEYVDEVVTETHISRENGQNTEKEVDVPYGFNVYFPAGHSIRVRTEEELRRLGYDRPAELIDEDGEVVGSTAQQTLKRNVQHRASASKRRKAHTAPIDAD